MKEFIKKIIASFKLKYLLIFLASLAIGAGGTYLYTYLTRSKAHFPVNTLIVKAKGDYAYKNTTNEFQTQFKVKPTDANSIVFANDLGKISFFTPKDQSFGTITSSNEPKTEGGTITYPDIYPELDVRYTLSSTRLLEEFIVKDANLAAGIDRIGQIANTKATYEQNEDGSITFKNEDQTAFTLPRPVMYEVGNKDIKSEGISYEISKDKDSIIIIKVISDDGKKWLMDEGRTYPIAIDLVIDNGISTNWVSSDSTFTTVLNDMVSMVEGISSVMVRTYADNISNVVDLMEYPTDHAARAVALGTPIVATGGTITNVGGYTIHKFTTSGTFTVTSGSGNVEVLTVAGGGGGGNDMGGGGGGGGVIYTPAYAVGVGAIGVTVGGGGAGSVGPYAATPVSGTNGQNSVFGTVTALGGGGGGSGHRTDAPYVGGAALVGGSGGGAAARYMYGSSRQTLGAYGTFGQGTRGGNAPTTNTNYYAGGGGGAGGNSTSDAVYGTNAGHGGPGLPSSILGTLYYFGAGGGGGAHSAGPAGNGGQGGGGGGSTWVAPSAAGIGGTGGLNNGANGSVVAGAVVGGAGGTNTGSGGGGGNHQGNGGNGGSGIVVIRYPTATFTNTGYVTNASLPTATGGQIAYLSGYTMHKFTSSGTFTPSTARYLDALVVAGGGGGANTGGGGGGGGYLFNTSFSVTATGYPVTVGAGGAGGATPGAAGANGANSVFSTMTAVGGGGGSSHGNTAGLNGGSGGGGALRPAVPASTGGTGSQGFAGGVGYVDAGWVGNNSGGGGAGAVGGAGTTVAGSGAGGAGLSNNITGSTDYYAVGGGGSPVNGTQLGGGSGNGGGGNSGFNAVGSPGLANTGGGGGSGSYSSLYYNGGAGGSGVVILRYVTEPLLAFTESSNKTQGNYALKIVSNGSDSFDKTVIRTISPTLNLSNRTSITFDAGSLTGNRDFIALRVAIHDTGGTTTLTTPVFNTGGGGYQRNHSLDLSAVANVDKDAIDQIIITNLRSGNTLYIDNMVAQPTTFTTNDTVTRTTTATNLSGFANITYWVKSSVPGTYATFGFGETTGSEQTQSVTASTSWEKKTWNIEGIAGASKDAVTKYEFKFTSDTSGAIFNFDDIQTDAIFRPTLGASSALSPSSIRWAFTDNATGETGYKIYDGSNSPLITCATQNIGYCDEINLSTNTQYTRKIGAYGASSEAINPGTVSLYTLAAVPASPVVSARTATTLSINPDPSTNPANTQFAIYKETGITCDGVGGSYLAANGSDNGATAVWQTDAAWGTVTATGLSADNAYVFCVKAKNGDNIETSFSGRGIFDNVGYIPISGSFVYTGTTIRDSSTLINRYGDGNGAGRNIIGVDDGGTPNRAIFEANSGVMTINANDTLAVGVLDLTGGSVAIAQGGIIKIGEPIWYVDTDNDGFSNNGKLYVGSQPPGGKRKNTATAQLLNPLMADCNTALSGYNFTLPSATYYIDTDADTFTSGSASAGTAICANAATWSTATSISTPGSAVVTNFGLGTRRTIASGAADCNDGSYNATNTCCAIATRYRDADGDGYGNASVTISACTTAGYVDNSTDCLDSDANVRTKNATGGTITNITGYRVHSFTASGTFTITCGGTTSVEYIVVAGGGSGGSSKVSWGGGGGGGAGGYLSGTMSATQGTGYSATVGAGGVARAVSSNLAGANGGNSVFSSFTAIGGGGGGFGGGPGQSVAVAGGSGGGAGYSPDFGPYWCYAGGAAGTAGQGNAGAGVPACDGAGGAGGGGAGSVGGFRTGGSSGGAGGAGIASSITGSSITRAAGGKGGDSAILPLTGAANTGNAGGGAYAQNAASGAGGSGIVIVRYANP